MPKLNVPSPPVAQARQQDKLRISTQLYLAVGVATLIGALVASYMQASSGLEALQQFEHVNKQVDNLSRLRRLLLDAETSTRGYLLTHDPSYLDPYGKAVPEIRATIRALEQDYAHDPDKQASANELIQIVRRVINTLETASSHAQQGLPVNHEWLELDNMLMETFRFKHDVMRLKVLASNAKNVERSMRGFQNARVSTVLLAIVSLLLLLLTIVQGQRKQELQERINQLLFSKNEFLESEVTQRTEELTSLATYLTNVREAEKMNLARELHDELGALLTAAKLDADWVERTLPQDVREQVASRMARLRKTLTSGITLKRRITNNLRPALLHDLGLLAALKSLAEEFQRGNEIELELILPEVEPELPEAISLSLFRIVQEGFTNIQNHSKAHHVTLSLQVHKKAIELIIEDDGFGFDPNSPKIARHGLSGIKHRVFTHGGKLDIHSAPGDGVRIRVILPAQARTSLDELGGDGHA
ncbi:MAG: CHASE3 domain-containing protein [Thiobacillus sp.]|nr:CHASE3 domain-containing protein [Thiobacillus sp.]